MYQRVVEDELITDEAEDVAMTPEIQPTPLDPRHVHVNLAGTNPQDGGNRSHHHPGWTG